MFDRRNIKYTYLKLSKKIKDFLLSDKSREFLIFLFFFLFINFSGHTNEKEHQVQRLNALLLSSPPAHHCASTLIPGREFQTQKVIRCRFLCIG